MRRRRRRRLVVLRYEAATSEFNSDKQLRTIRGHETDWVLTVSPFDQQEGFFFLFSNERIRHFGPGVLREHSFHPSPRIFSLL